MKANELRIGNWVMIDLSSIPQQVCDVMCDCVTTENTRGAHYGLVDAIPLTEKLLLKFGYLKCSFRENYYEIKGHCIWKCNEMFLCDKNGVHIKHVHQLQNLYFALTGEELTYGGNK